MKPVTDPSLLSQLDTDDASYGSPVTDTALLAQLEEPEGYSRGPLGRGARVEATPANLTERAKRAVARGVPVADAENLLVDALRERSYSVDGQAPTNNIADQGIPEVDPFDALYARAGSMARGGRGHLGRKLTVDPSTISGPYMRGSTIDNTPRSWGEMVSDFANAFSSGADEAAAAMVEAPTRALNVLSRFPDLISALTGEPMVDMGQGNPALRNKAPIPFSESQLDYTKRKRQQAADRLKYGISPGGRAYDEALGNSHDFVDTIKLMLEHPGAAVNPAGQTAGALLPGAALGPDAVVQLMAQAVSQGGMNANQVEETLLAAGMDPETARAKADEVFGMSAAMNAAIPAIVPGGQAAEKMVQRFITGEGLASATGSRLARFAVPTAGEIVGEGLPEGLDQVLANVATGAPVMQDVGQQTALGAMLGAPGGVAAGTVDALHTVDADPLGDRRAENAAKIAKLVQDLTTPGKRNPLSEAIQKGLQTPAAPPTAAPVAASPVAPDVVAPAADPYDAAIQRADELRARAARAAPAPQPSSAPEPVQDDLAPRMPATPDIEPGVTREQLVGEYVNASSDETRAAAAARIAAFEQRNAEEARSGQAEAEEGSGQEGAEGRQGDRGLPEQAQAGQQGQAVSGDRAALESPIGQVAQERVARVQDAPRLVVHSNTADKAELPPDIHARSVASGGIDAGVEGFYDEKNDTIHLFAAAVDDPARMAWVVDHELSHAMLRSVARRNGLGITRTLEQAGTNEAVQQLIASMAQGRPERGTILKEEAVVELATALHRGGWDHIESTYGIKVPQNMREGATTVLRRVVEAIRKIINKALGRDSMTDADIYNLLERINAERNMDRTNSGKEKADELSGRTDAGAGAAEPRVAAAAHDDAARGQRASDADNAPAHAAPARGPVGRTAGAEPAAPAAAGRDDAGQPAAAERPDDSQAAGNREEVARQFRAGVRYDEHGQRVPAEAFKRRPDESFEEWRQRVIELQRNTTVFSRKVNMKVVAAIREAVPEAEEIWFHGSRARGDHRRNSDWDILVQVPNGTDRLTQVLALQQVAKGFPRYDIQPASASSTIMRFAKEEGVRLDGGVAFSRAPPTDSAAFKRWFGDSKVVNEDGSPKVVYHGTSRSYFDKFDLDHAVEGAFFFSSDGGHASAFAGEPSERLSFNNPAVFPVYLSLQNPAIVPGSKLGETPSLDEIEEMISTAREHGFDGIIVTNFRDHYLAPKGTDTYIAFQPNQIKSATGNNGNFSTTDDSIVASRARTRGGLLRDLTETEQRKVTDKVAEKVIAQLSNLPSATEMAAVARAGEAKRGWYAESAQTLSDVFGPDAPRFAMLLAALSPQTSVESNLANALNTWKNWTAAGRPTEREDIVRILGQSVEGERGESSVLNAWINNSVRALSNADLTDVVISGPKVNSFYQNLIGNTQEVTNDAWMAAYAAVNQTIFKGGLNKAGTEPGKGTGYMAMNSLVRRTARQLTERDGHPWTPAEVQETVWSWAKALTELADSAGETRSAEQLVVDQAVTDELIASTPDFATLFTRPKYRSILEEAGYGEQVQERAERNAARAAGEESAAGRKARPAASAAEQKLVQQAARRIDRARKQRLDAERVASPGEYDAEAAVPFSRKPAKNVYGPVQGTDLRGLPSKINIPGRGLIEFHGFEPAQSIAREFAARHGHELPRDYVRVDPDQGERIANQYQVMKHDPKNVWVKRAYDAMIRETMEQYDAMLATGLQVEFIPEGMEDPYAKSPRLAILDVVENNHLWVFPTTGGFGSDGVDRSDNPLLQPTKYQISDRTALANDVFRAVHDYFGHIANGVGFRADGEENAWREHSAMYSPLARQAMTSETRGQNSWVNFGPYSEENRTASAAKTEYAPQKTGLMPRWVIDGVPQVAEVTQTPAFKKWFGDSQVVDNDGNPKMMFHGTISPEGFQFTEFSHRTGRNGSPSTVNAIGSWFSDEPEHANIFSGAAADPNTGGMQRAIAGVRAGTQYISEGGHVFPVYLSIQNPLEVRDGEHMQRLWEDWGQGKGRWSKGEPEFFRDRLKAAGYDGIRFLEADKVDDFKQRGEYWVALDPQQVKSAIGNNGNFDPWEENVTFSRKFNAKKVQPDAVAVDAIHFSNTEGLNNIDPKKAGSAGAGGERRRFGIGQFGKQGGTAARVAFYVHEEGADMPQAEDVVRAAGGIHPYGVHLTNLYDLDADPRGLVSRNIDATEEAISEEGFDGFVTGGQSGIDGRVAVVYDIGNKKIPVEPVSDVVFQRVFHGTPHTVDKFSLQKIGTGEGAQAFGWGLYFADDKALAQKYQRDLSERQSRRRVLIDGTEPSPYDRETINNKYGPLAARYVGILLNSPTKKRLNDVRLDVLAEYDALRGTIAIDGLTGDETTDLDKKTLANLERVMEMLNNTTVTNEKGEGNTYGVDIPEPHELLQYDDEISTMSQQVQDSLRAAWNDVAEGSREEYLDRANVEDIDELTGNEFYQLMVRAATDDALIHPHPDLTERAVSAPEQASHHLYTHGIPGLRFLAGGHRNKMSKEKLEQMVARAQADYDAANKAIDALKPPFDPELYRQLDNKSFDAWTELEAAKKSLAEWKPPKYNYVMWDESQISAPEIVFSRGVPLPPPSGVVPLSHALDEAREKLQDRMLRLRRAQEHVGPISDTMDAYTLENLMYGATKDQLDAVDREIKRLQKMMKRSGLTPDQLQDYLLARHAPERNAKVASINPQVPDAGSGITTQEANDILAGRIAGPYSNKVLTPDTISKAQAAAAIIDAFTAQTLQVLEDTQQITPALASTLRSTYQHYVPLKGSDSEPDWSLNHQGTGKGLNVGGSGIRRALGRGQGNIPDNILGETVAQLQRAIVQGEKAKVTQAFLKFAKANPMPDLFTVEPVDMEWKFSKATGQAYLGVKSTFSDADRSIIVPDNGKHVRIRFEDQRLRDAIMHMGVQDLAGFVKIAGSINRLRSATLTRFNPAFTPINILRDLQFGITALLAEHGPAVTASALKDYPAATAALWRDARNPVGDSSVPDAQKTMDDWTREFAETGVKTGLTQVDDVQDLQARLATGAATLMQLAAQGRPLTVAKESIIRTMKPLLDTVEDINDATENALRLSTYVALRKNGMSKVRAGAIAKNLTINFNRKGSWGPVLNSIYLFYNASMQGAHATQRLLRHPGVLASLTALGALQAFLAASMMHDDDDDGVTTWDMVPDYVKRTSLVIPLGQLTGNEADYFALPMPYGFNLFPYGGGRIAQWVEQGAREGDNSLFMDMVKSTTEAFSPVPLFDGYNALFGDTVGSLMQLAANKDDLGQPIAMDPDRKAYPMPRALMGKPDTARAYQATSQLLAKMGGADLEKRIPPIGFLDVAPEQLEFMANFLGGGLANIASKSTRWWEQSDAKNFERPMDYVTAAPIASRLLGTGSEARAVAKRYAAEQADFARRVDLVKAKVRGGMDPDQAIKEAALEEPSLRGVNVDRYKKDTKPSRNMRGGKKGDPKVDNEGMPKFEGEEGSVFAELKDVRKEVEDLNSAIQDVRDASITNDQVVKIMGRLGFYSLGDLGLEEGYTTTATAPNRVRQRSIKLLQELREKEQKRFLKATKKARTQ